MAAKKEWKFKDAEPAKETKEAAPAVSTNKEFKRWDEMTEKEQDERREQASVEGKEKYEKMTDAERQALKGSNFYDFENNPASAMLAKSIEEHKDITFISVGTTGLLGSKTPDLTVKSKGEMVKCDYPTQFAAKTYTFKDGEYVSKDRIYIPMISVPEDVLERTLKSIEAGGYDVFTTGGIDKDTYVSGKGVTPMEEAAKKITAYLEKNGESVMTGYNTLFASSMLAHAGIVADIPLDLMAVANEQHNAVSSGKEAIFGQEDILEAGKRVTLENIYACIANEVLGEAGVLDTTNTKANAQALITLELIERSKILTMQKEQEASKETVDTIIERQSGQQVTDQAAKAVSAEAAPSQVESTGATPVVPTQKDEVSDLRFLAQQIAEQNKQLAEQNRLIQEHTIAVREQITAMDKLWGSLSIVAPDMNAYLTMKARTKDEPKDFEKFIQEAAVVENDNLDDNEIGER